MAFQDWVLGTTDGDRTGDKVLGVFTKIKAMLEELYALVGSSGTGYLSMVASSGSTNDVDPAGGFPASISWLDVDTTAGDATWTGLKAGSNGQEIAIRVIGTGQLSLSAGTDGTGDTGSIAANRFSGEGQGAQLSPNAVNRITYRSLPSPRWAIG